MPRVPRIRLGLVLALWLAAPVVRADEETQGVSFLDDPASLEAVLARASAEKKDVLVHFTAEWCGFCHQLDTEVFSKPEAARALAPYVCVRVDVEKRAGGEIAAGFHVNGYPTVLFLDARGREIDRLTGYAPLKPFLEDVARITRDENTLRSLSAYVADHPDDLEVATHYLNKLVLADPPQAEVLLAGLLEQSKAAEPRLRARILLLAADTHRDAGRHDEAFAAWERVIREVPVLDEAREAAWSAGWLGCRVDPTRGLALVEAAARGLVDPEARTQLAEMRVELHEAALGEALEVWARQVWGDGEALNEVAWRAYRLGVRGEQAILWAERAVELTRREPAVLDTLANLLFAANRWQAAIELEAEAMRTARDPQTRRHFQGELLRFKAEFLSRSKEAEK